MLRRLSLVLVCVALALPLQAVASPPRGVDKWALIIGVDHFQGRTRPNVGAVGDADDFREVLVRSGWPADHVRVLTDGAATQAGIREGLRWLRDRTTDRSYSVVHYSGHVKQTGGHEYLWPHDNRFIADVELGEWVRSLRGWVWVDVSGCEAAGFDEGISAPNRLFTAASQVHEKAYEYPRWRNSVFTGLLVEQAILQGRADYDRNRRVSVTEAFRYAAQEAPRMTAGQSSGPQHPYAAGGDNTEWFLDPPAPPEPAVKAPEPPPARKCNPFCIEL